MSHTQYPGYLSLALPYLGGDKHLIGRMVSQPMKSDAEPDPRAYLPRSDFRTWHSQFELDCQGHHFGSFPLSYFEANRRHHLPYNPYIYYDLLSNSIIPVLSLDAFICIPFSLSKEDIEYVSKYIINVFKCLFLGATSGIIQGVSAGVRQWRWWVGSHASWLPKHR